MYALINSPKFLHSLINKQFEMIGHPEVTFNDLEKNTTVTVMEGKKEKKVEWWKYYRFENEDQYNKWRMWAKIEIAKLPDVETDRQLEENINFLDLAYGLTYKIIEPGKLF